MTEQFVMPVFDTVQAAADYGRPESVLREMMEAMYPGAKTFVWIGVGTMKYSRMGFPAITGHYHTHRFGRLDDVDTSALAVGDIHTDGNGVTWEVVANVTRQGSAEWPGSHVFCAVEVAND